MLRPRAGAACSACAGAVAANPGSACSPCAGAAGGCRRCRCSLCVVLRRPRQPVAGGRGVGLPPFLCVARSAWRSWGRRAQPGGGWPAHRVATGAPAGLLGRGHWHCVLWAVVAFACPPAHRDSTGPGNGSNGPPQTLSKKRKHRRSLRKHVAAVAVRLLLSAVRLLLRSCGVSLLPLPCGCRVLPRCAAPRSRRRCCVAALRTQPLLPVAKLRISR
jgi:hypothetical protein